MTSQLLKKFDPTLEKRIKTNDNSYHPAKQFLIFAIKSLN